MPLDYYIQEGVEGQTNLKKLYKECNAEYFGGALPNIKVAWNSKIKRAAGRAYCQYFGKVRKSSLTKYLDEIPVSTNVELDMSSLKIHISSSFDLQLNDVKAIMLHEQVHILLFSQKKIGSHHDSPEFQNWIKKLTDKSGIKIPMRESDFKASPKLAAKEGYIVLVYDKSNVGLTMYTKNFIQKSWLELGKFLARMVNISSKMNRIEMYKVKHPVVSAETGRRSLKSISFSWIEEETANEIKRMGTQFFFADKNGGEMQPHKVVPASKGTVYFDNRGNPSFGVKGK